MTGGADEPVLRVRGLTKHYGGVRVVDGIEFDLFPGEVLTLLGPSGCGKTTTLRMIAGLEPPDEGEIWVRGRLVASPLRRIMVPPEGRNLGLVFQSYAIWPHMSVAENVAYPLKVRRLDAGARAQKVETMIRLMKLDGLAARMPSELSGGQQQRVALARALVYEPELLLLDEPLSNLDAILRKEMRSQLRALQSRLATTVLYVTHDQEEAMALSSRVIVMNRGRMEQMAVPHSIYEQPVTRFVRDFVGQTICLRGVIEQDEIGLALRIGGGRLPLPRNGAAPPPAHGMAAELSLRPEDVRLLPRIADDAGIAGQVLEVTYYGDRLECAIRIDAAGEQVVVANAAKGERIAAGDRVVLAIDPARARLWPL